MIWLLNNRRLIACIALLGGSFIGGLRLGSDSVQQDWNKEKLGRAEQHLATALRFQREQVAREETKDANLKTIDDIRRGFNRERLRLSEAPCAGSLPATGGEENRPARAGKFLPAIPTRAEEALREFDDAYFEAAGRADKVVEECRAIQVLQ